MRSPGTCGLRSISPMVALTARSSARVFQYMPFSPARPNGVRTPSTKKMSDISATLPPRLCFSQPMSRQSSAHESVGSNLRTRCSRIVSGLPGLYKCIGDLLCSLGNLPGAGAEFGERGADGLGGVARRLPGDATQVFGGEEVLDR